MHNNIEATRADAIQLKRWPRASTFVWWFWEEALEKRRQFFQSKYAMEAGNRKQGRRVAGSRK